MRLAEPAGSAAGAAPLHQTSIAVMTRATMPGEVKTRLIPALGAAGAARLHVELTRRTLRLAAAAAPAALDLWLALSRHAPPHPPVTRLTEPPPGDPAFEHLFDAHPRTPVRWHAQGAGHLGLRMKTAARWALGAAPQAQHGIPPTSDDTQARMQGDGATRLLHPMAQARRVLIIGTDCPARQVTDLMAGSAALADHDVVLQPATDGGYVMIGLQESAGHPAALKALFDGIAWGGATVLAETRQRAAAAGLRVALLRPLPDLDVPADLADAVAAGLVDVTWHPQRWPNLRGESVSVPARDALHGGAQG